MLRASDPDPRHRTWFPPPLVIRSVLQLRSKASLVHTVGGLFVGETLVDAVRREVMPDLFSKSGTTKPSLKVEPPPRAVPPWVDQGRWTGPTKTY